MFPNVLRIGATILIAHTKERSPPEGAELSETVAPRLGQRAVYFRVELETPRWLSFVVAIAEALSIDDVSTAESLIAREFGDRESHDQIDSDLQALRAEAIVRVLVDLARSRWGITREDGRIYVHPPLWPESGHGLSPSEIVSVKSDIRQSLARRVSEQLRASAPRQFIYEMERPRLDIEGFADVRALIADGALLADSIRAEGASAIKPYLQAATPDDGPDLHTGLRLSDIYRYFRYYWSIPSESIPGRTMPFLVRDAGQPRHPVCGLLNLASPVPKLAVRDDALGWTPAWLEAVVATLDCVALGDRESLEAVTAQIAGDDSDQTTRARASRIIRDVSALLRLPSSDTSHDLLKASRRIATRTLRSRVTHLQQGIFRDLRGELTIAIREISVRNLAVTHDDIFANPTRAIQKLASLAASSRDAWSRSRSGLGNPRSSEGAGSEENLEVLFEKKRANQLLSLAKGWEDLSSVKDELRLHVLGSTEAWSPDRGLTDGRSVRRGIRKALSLRQNRFIATQVADVTVCGALPPYDALLGGKLVALLALSREVASEYHCKYSNRESEISSRMGDAPVVRAANLLALTTTSLYAVGSSQYNRLRVPSSKGEIRWSKVGVSAGHGTIHFSAATSNCLNQVLRRESGAALFTSTFGEGPSERLRKLSSGLSRLKLPADELLRHGMPRIVYLAELQSSIVRPGARDRAAPWRRVGPSIAEITAWWRERWLEPRLETHASLLSDLAATGSSELMLGRRLHETERQS